LNLLTTHLALAFFLHLPAGDPYRPVAVKIQPANPVVGEGIAIEVQGLPACLDLSTLDTQLGDGTIIHQISTSVAASPGCVGRDAPLVIDLLIAQSTLATGTVKEDGETLATYTLEVKPKAETRPKPSTGPPPREPPASGPSVVIEDASTHERLLGEHPLALQWISWNHFGKVSITEAGGRLRVLGEQRARKGNDLLTIDGFITTVQARQFTFEGRVLTRISHLNGGRECLREGRMVFRATGKRRYWRLRQMDNPCDAVVDYVDVYFKVLPPQKSKGPSTD
jgi:hypothetical protein